MKYQLGHLADETKTGQAIISLFFSANGVLFEWYQIKGAFTSSQAIKFWLPTLGFCQNDLKNWYCGRLKLNSQLLICQFSLNTLKFFSIMIVIYIPLKWYRHEADLLEITNKMVEFNLDTLALKHLKLLQYQFFGSFG